MTDQVNEHSMAFGFQVPVTILNELLAPVAIPPFALIRNHMSTPPPLADPGAEVRRQLQATGILSSVPEGGKVAIGVGSRGIDHLPDLVAAVVAEIRAAGALPFIVPSMGSHGGATADGQREVLAHLGVTPERVGAPVEASMDTVVIGRTEQGNPVYIDGLAVAADGIVVVARIKPHTAFRGPYESGMAKMIAIGLGKQAGAAATHAYGFGRMAEMVPAMARVALAQAPILGAVGVLENAHDRIFKLVVVPANRIMAEEPALLDEARTAMPRIPFSRFDVLVIDEIGKNISGDGADPNITGRYPTPDASGGPEVTRQVVLDLTAASHGNANGVGTSDFTTLRLARKMDLGQTYPNALTSTVPGPVKIPMVLPSDRLAMAAAILTCHAVDRPPRVVRISNTLRLDEFLISQALIPELPDHPELTRVREPFPLEFDVQGNLRDLAGIGVPTGAV